MMNIKMQPSDLQKLSPKIAVIGVGGAGGNAVNNMIASNLEGCEFLVCNTDAQALEHSLSENAVQMGTNVTGGLGAGSNPEIGKAAAEESLEEMLRYLDGANMAFVTCGMGGGTGTGAAPVIAKACRQQGILTVGVVTKPFHFEGAHRMRQAEEGIKEMQQYVDTLIVIPNQNLFRIANEKTTFAEGFKMADTVLQSGVRGVTDLMVRPGLVNLDFADIRTAMMQMGKAMMGTGEATGERRAIEAAEAAINNPLLDDVSMKGANGVIINVTGGYDMTLFEADEACNRIRDEVDPNANIIFGATFDDSMEGVMRVSIVATGIETKSEQADKPTEKVTTSAGGFTGGGRPMEAPAVKPVATSAVSSPIAPKTEKSEASEPEKFDEAAKEKAEIEARRASLISGRDMVRGLTAPARPAQTLSSGLVVKSSEEDTKMETESVDMYEQAEFAAQEEPMLRGSTVNGAFIPPKPMEADVQIPESGIGAHISNYHGDHVPAEIAERAEKAEKKSGLSGLRFNPPRMMSETTETSDETKAQRSPSLFERITGSVQNTIENMRDDHDMLKAAPLTGERQKPVMSDAPAQGQLDIEAPSKPAAKVDEELDIPAFLRRQAN